MNADVITTKVKPLASIRLRLYATIIFITLLTLALAVVNLMATQQLQEGVRTTISEVGRVSELGLHTQNQFLLARESEAGFLSNWRIIGVDQAKTDYAATHQGYLEAALRDLDEITALTQSQTNSGLIEIAADDISRLKALLGEYQSNFQATVAAVEVLNQQGGIEDQLDAILFDLRQKTAGLPSSEYEQIVLELQVNQEAFLATKQQQYRDKIRILVNQFKDLIAQGANNDFLAPEATANPAELVVLVESFLEKFQVYSAQENEISVYVESFADITDEIGQLSLKINVAGAAGLAKSRQQLEMVGQSSRALSIVAAAAAITLGIIASIALARRIIAPLNTLMAAATRMREGELGHRVHLGAQDEFNVLAVTLNQMAKQVGEMFASLEHEVAVRTKELHTSIEVSQRLNSILDQKLLVKEVVEQLQTAFGYYHAHIYLVDAARENLVMAGGTGDAGRTLLERGHKIARGTGLVGKAAETCMPVLVSDVSENPSWLPNALLPDTRSEAAVPILAGQEVLGVLDVQQNAASALGENDVELLKSIASLLAIALQNARSYEQAQRQAERQQQAAVISRKIQSASSIEDVLKVAVRELGQVLGARQTKVEVGLASPQSSGINQG